MELKTNYETKPRRQNTHKAILLLGFLLLSGAIVGTGSSAKASEDKRNLNDLEDTIWLAEDHELPFLEQRVAREIQLAPRSAKAHYMMALVLKRSFSNDPGDLLFLKQASQTAQQAVDLDPQSDYGYIAMADVLDLMGNGDKGVALLDDAELTGIKPSWRFYFARARLIADSANTKTVLGLLETALAFTDSHPKIIIPYVVAVLKTEYKGSTLISALKDWNSRHSSPLFDLTLAIEYEERSDHIKAHRLYQKILASAPDDREANINDSVILYKHLGRSKQAINQLNHVLKLKTTKTPNYMKSIIHAHIGSAYLQLKKHKQAEDAFATALKIDSENLNLIDFIANSYRKNRAAGHLATLLRNVSKTQKGSGVVYALLAETLSEKLGNHDEAIRAFSDAIVLDPERSDYYNGMGLAYYRKKEFGTALGIFGEATKIDPNDAVARYNEACVHSILNQKSKALNKLKDALALDPRLSENIKTDADLDNLRNEPAFLEMLPTTAIGH